MANSQWLLHDPSKLVSLHVETLITTSGRSGPVRSGPGFHHGPSQGMATVKPWYNFCAETLCSQSEHTTGVSKSQITILDTPSQSLTQMVHSYVQALLDMHALNCITQVMYLHVWTPDPRT